MIKQREELEKHLNITIDKNKHDRNVVNQVKEALLEDYGLLEGETQRIFKDQNLKDMNKNLLILFTQELYNATQEPNISPVDYFSPEEIKKARTESSFTPVVQKTDFPMVVNSVIELSPQDFITKMRMSKVVKLYNSGLIDYDFRSQRNAKIVKRGGFAYRTPNINKNSVKEITNKITEGSYFPDPITLNLILGSNEDNDELTYDPNKKNLYINGGSMHILDGFHRLNAFVNVILENPDLDLDIPVNIKNYDIEDARKYFGQINTINPIDTGHLKQLKSERYSDIVVKKLMSDSDLKGKVSQSNRIDNENTQIVTYSMLSDTINEEFQLESNRDTLLLSKYATDFFNFLIGSNEEAFLHDVKGVKKKSLINYNFMFAGYIVLMRRFREKNIPVEYIEDVLNKIDFSRENDLWEEIGVLNKNHIARNAKREVKRFFNQIDIDEVKTND